MIFIRRAVTADADAMVALLNDIIAEGGTTAITDPLTRAAMIDWMSDRPDQSAWHLAEDSGGVLLGFQWIGPWHGLPGDTCEIATFVRIGNTGLGIGSRLFDATRSAAEGLGYAWINAEIRADNAGGLAYYQSRGFREHGRRDKVALSDHTEVSKVMTRFDLKD